MHIFCGEKAAMYFLDRDRFRIVDTPVSLATAHTLSYPRSVNERRLNNPTPQTDMCIRLREFVDLRISTRRLAVIHAR